MIQLRHWQQQALAIYRKQWQRGDKSILWEATPGAGKTTAALQVCLHQLDEGGSKNVIIVVPTTHLKRQWSTSAAQINIDIDNSFRTKWGLSRDYDGLAVTYQQVANSPATFRSLARNAVVVLDEIHHAGVGHHWGEALENAFDSSKFILALSGTAFRSDNSAIPFVSYNNDGESRPDYIYGYSQAIEEGVCRPIAFFTYGGEVAWMEAGETIEAGFGEDLYGTMAARRLRVALEPDSGWVKPMILDAHQMLRETRRTHPDAAGLLVAADQDHARSLAQLLAEISGTWPTVVLSDDPEASNKIKDFSYSNREWIVACNMVSEGVDIPRLRVGVYATTISTKMYFRQFLGRMVRVTPDLKGIQVAYVYLPADPRLKRLAEEVESEIAHVLKRRPDLDWREEVESSGDIDPSEPSWSALYSSNSGLDSVILGGQQLSLFDDPQFIPVQTSEMMQAKIRQKVEERVHPLTLAEQKELLAKKITGLVGRVHFKTKMPYPEIHGALNRRQGVRGQTTCTLEQLQKRVQFLQQMLS
ncbi:MAG: superfamily II DNA or RNA helicase [Cellvibrionaceae bacterium]